MGISFLLIHLQHTIKREIGVHTTLPELGQAENLRDMPLLIDRVRVEWRTGVGLVIVYFVLFGCERE